MNMICALYVGEEQVAEFETLFTAVRYIIYCCEIHYINSALSVFWGTGYLTQTTKDHLYLIENCWILFVPCMLVKNKSLCLKQYLLQWDKFYLKCTKRMSSCWTDTSQQLLFFECHVEQIYITEVNTISNTDIFSSPTDGAKIISNDSLLSTWALCSLSKISSTQQHW